MLNSSFIPLKKEAIEAFIITPHDLKLGQIHLLESIGSTNDYLKTQDPSQGIDVCLTEQQTAGRGRRGRAWHSPFGSNIYLTCRWVIKPPLFDLSGLSLVIALALITALEKSGITGLSIKWPNDLIWQDKKLAGILIETALNQDGSMQVMIGIGINVNMAEADLQAIDQPWTSLASIQGCAQDRNPIVGQILNQLLTYLSLFQTQGWIYFLDLWKQYDRLKDKKIHFLAGDHQIEGFVRGVNHKGYLLIENTQGEIYAYAAGEINSLRFDSSNL